VELTLITMQRWRGTASHFNQATNFDAGVWSALGTMIIFLTLGIALLLIGPAVRFHGSPAARIAALAGLVGVLVAGYVGKDMAAIGEAAVDATGHVPHDVMFGAAGSAKLAHAVGLHSIQGSRRARDSPGVRPVGRPHGGRRDGRRIGGLRRRVRRGPRDRVRRPRPYDPTVPMALLLVGGVVALGAVAAIALANLPRPAPEGAIVKQAELAGRGVR
jgi:hypothetical protein